MKRRFEWLSGRWALKNLIRLSFPDYWQLNLKDIEISNEAGGAPYILLRGEVHSELAVSISHRGQMAAAAAARCEGARLGIDLELSESRPNSFIEDYFTPNEIAQLKGIPEPEKTILVNLFWSAREAFLKGERIGLRLDTRCLEVKLDSELLFDQKYMDTEWKPFDVLDQREHPARYSGFWQADQERVLTLVWANRAGKHVSGNLCEVKIENHLLNYSV